MNKFDQYKDEVEDAYELGEITFAELNYMLRDIEAKEDEYYGAPSLERY